MIDGRTCKCGLYFPSVASMKRHTKWVHSNAVKVDEDVASDEHPWRRQMMTTSLSLYVQTKCLYTETFLKLWSLHELMQKPFLSNEVAKTVVYSQVKVFSFLIKFANWLQLVFRIIISNFLSFIPWTSTEGGGGVQSFVHTCPQGGEGGSEKRSKSVHVVCERPLSTFTSDYQVIIYHGFSSIKMLSYSCTVIECLGCLIPCPSWT